MNFIQFEEVIGRLRCIKDTLTGGSQGYRGDAEDVDSIFHILTSAYPEFADEYHKDSIRMLSPPRFKP